METTLATDGGAGFAGAGTNYAADMDAEGLFRRYGPMVLRRCSQLLGCDDAAADVAQEIFVKLVEKKGSLVVRFPSSLLWKMATNRCLNIIRDRIRREGFAGDEPLLERIANLRDVDIETDVENRSVLRKLFGRHPKSSRTIAVLHLIDGMTLEETAREVNMSVSGVRKRLRALRETLGEMKEIEEAL